MVFAINKIDKPGANADRVREELSAMNLLVEEWGGKYQCQEISAKKGHGVNDLLEKVLLEAEMLDLKANPNRKATGSIIESSLDKGRGYVSTVLVSNGTLRVGDNIIAGTSWGRIKAMFNERNQRIESAGPAEPAIILGLNGAPTAGDSFHTLETEQEARDIANKRLQLQREQGLRTQKRLTLSDISHRIALGSFKELNIIVKGDTEVNRMERDIEHRCMTLLLRQQPVAGDLRRISTTMKVVTDVERIGDHASDIAEIVPHLVTVSKEGDAAVSQAIKMGQKAHKMILDALTALTSEDAQAALRVIAADDEVDYDFNAIKHTLAQEIAADPGKVDAALDLLMVIKYLERIGDHAVNIAEWV